MPLGEGHWISPTGEIIEVYMHLDYIQDNKEKLHIPAEAFMLTDEERKLGPKGPAAMRARVLSDVIRRGWIRLRRAPGMTPTFEVWRTTDDALFRIAEGIRAHGLADRGEMIRIVDHRRQTADVMNVTDLLSGKVFAQNPPLQIATITFVYPMDEHELQGLERWIEIHRDLGLIVTLHNCVLKLANWNAALDEAPIGSARFREWAGERAGELQDMFSTDAGLDVS